MEYMFIVLLLLGSAFCSGTEIAYTSLSKLKLRKENETPSRTQRLVSYIYHHYENALSTILIGNNLVNIAATSLATVIAMRLVASMDGRVTEDAASSIVTMVMTVLILIVGEITPKMIARRCSDRFAQLAAYPLIVLMVLFFPAVWITGLVVKLFSLLWRNKGDQNVTITEAELETILDTAEDAGVIDENETELLQSALEFSDMDAGDILTPRIDVVGFDIADSMEHILQVINDTQFSRYLVYERTVDHVVGILYVKHLLKELVENPDVRLEDIILEPVFIPKSMHLHAIMNEFRNSQTHMAVVADEYGGITGIVTMEDVLEQLVGEIWDENDDIVNDWQQLAKDRFECAGDLNLAEFCDHLDLDDEDLDTTCATVGGWATEKIGAMPVPFDSFDYDRFTMLVKEVDENYRIVRMLILEHHFGDEE
ncbi:MAG: HlyC/CorC family transporter [Oscillospiraceae bacterium]|nr:HlyC/CorC family transporter [Oscillospiraceae bacterium]